MANCKLCLQDRTLRRSHIVPEFLYADLYNGKHQLLAIHGKGRHGAEPLQKGLREPLLCEQCEQHINEHFEKPFKRMWVDAKLLPQDWKMGERKVLSVEYAPFKLFHLSVLFRAGVASDPTWSSVSLGAHSERIRRMLLELRPGSPADYRLRGAALLHDQNLQPVSLVSRAMASKYKGHSFFGMIYGGVQWWIKVSKAPLTAFDRDSLLANGTMPIDGSDWRYSRIVRESGAALRGELGVI